MEVLGWARAAAPLEPALTTLDVHTNITLNIKQVRIHLHPSSSFQYKLSYCCYHACLTFFVTVL